jgi:hypothetical protein
MVAMIPLYNYYSQFHHPFYKQVQLYIPPIGVEIIPYSKQN